MALQWFGYKTPEVKPAQSEVSFVPPTEDGTIDVFKAGAHFSTYVDFDGAAKTQQELIKRYRDTAAHSDVSMAIEDIVNEAIANLEDEDDPVELDLRKLNVSESVKTKIQTEFQEILRLLKFQHMAQDYFQRWYVDGCCYFHKVIEVDNPAAGIKDIRFIDPRKIKKIREVIKEKDAKTGVEFVKRVEEFYVYNQQGLAATRSSVATTQGLRITKDSIAFVSSGLTDRDTNMVLSHLHKAIKPANQLRMMENALVINRLARAPMRRIFYVDTGRLPKLKAEQFLKDQIGRYRNKLVYDADTGETRDDKKFMSMLEDIWLPRMEGSKGTEVETLPGDSNLGEITDVLYFQKKLYQSLNVPASRMDNEGASGLNFGKAAEISRDELKFIKFVNKLRRRFSMLFHDLLKTQLLLKNIITAEDWELMVRNIRFKYCQDAYYAQSREMEILKAQAETAGMLDLMVGRYISPTFIQKKVFNFSDEQIKEINTENQINHVEVRQVLTPEPEDPKKKSNGKK
jgi:hypothetical protein